MAGAAMAKRERPAAKQVVSADWRADLVAAESSMFRGPTYDWPDAFYFIEYIDIYTHRFYYSQEATSCPYMI